MAAICLLRNASHDPRNGEIQTSRILGVSVPMYLIRILALCAGAVFIFQCNLRQKKRQRRSLPLFIVDATLPRRIRHKADYFLISYSVFDPPQHGPEL